MSIKKLNTAFYYLRVLNKVCAFDFLKCKIKLRIVFNKSVYIDKNRYKNICFREKKTCYFLGGHAIPNSDKMSQEEKNIAFGDLIK